MPLTVIPNMVYDGSKRTNGDGVWHCPFSMKWVERMKRAAQCCSELTEFQIESCLKNEYTHIDIPPGDFLSEKQDARGLPLSYCQLEDERYRDWPECCIATYDYETVPEIVLTNGKDDWPYNVRRIVLTA